MDLAKQRCVPCEGGTPALTMAEARELGRQVPLWSVQPGRIERAWRCRDFAAAIAFIGRVAELAEEQGHHPDLHLEGYRNLRVVLWTHAVGGLSTNDFVMAARIDRLDAEASPA